MWMKFWHVQNFNGSMIDIAFKNMKNQMARVRIFAAHNFDMRSGLPIADRIFEALKSERKAADSCHTPTSVVAFQHASGRRT